MSSLNSWSRQHRNAAVANLVEGAKRQNTLPASPRLRVSSSESLALSTDWQNINLLTGATGHGSSLNTNEFKNSGLAYSTTDARFEFMGDKTQNYILSIEMRFTCAPCGSVPSLLASWFTWLQENSVNLMFRFVAGASLFPFPDSMNHRTLGSITPDRNAIDVQFLQLVYANEFLKTNHLGLQVKADVLDRSPLLAESIVLAYPI